ncbi:hypothetical protein SLEP1_g4951 [Rubroshorea leprosula]|uniref:NB-ARC domain-containing protein n=1 Tax=Rubroshorea leprosula TaxID=152421 RepID=A0AAV5HY76_9ROSI|nr:hypothetical protein SLEP1_g4951 [Rubroshorea leprosula]
MAKMMDKMMDKMVETVENFVDHHRKLEEDLNELRSEWQVLKRRKIDVNSRIQVEVEVQSGQVMKEEVKGWLEDVQKIEQEIQDVEERVGTVPYYKRASLDKLVCEKIEVVKRIQERGIFEGGLGIKRAPACGMVIPTENLEGEISTKDEIWEHLMGNKVGMIGVCGIGGVGKTTIMKHVNNDLLREIRFQKVIWVTVSYPLNVFELQKKIAGAMGERLPEDEEVMMRAAALMDKMRRVKFVLILDDVWEKFSLKDVGIPEPTVQNGCKIVITSRSIEVCKFLDCQIVEVQSLSQEESLTLFLNKVGHDVLQISGLEKILKLIVKECAGLPLAIVVIAGSMKGVDEIEVWRNALTELQECVESVRGSDDEIFMRLKFSFDRLPNEKIKNCFLYCSLFREDYSFEREELIEGWIDEGLMDGLSSRKAAYDRGHAFLDMLEKNSLLEKHQGEVREREVRKMHDVVRDMAIKSIGRRVGHMVKAGIKLTEIPNEHEWAIDLNKVSLMDNDILEIPVGFTPKCLTLSTLILSDNPLTEIPESFFEGMSGLKVLDLSRTNIETLPSSISKLKYLSALQLRGCEELKSLPSLEKLVALKKLDLRWAGIEVVPQGMEMLVCLEYLDLCCEHLEEIPMGILSKLSSLQYLVVGNGWVNGWVKINLEEVARLRKLEILECDFDDLQGFNDLLREFNNFRSFITFQLVVGTAMYYHDIDNPKYKCRLKICGCDIGEKGVVLPDKLQHLRIHKCKSIGSSLDKIALLENATKLGVCIISNCEETQYVVELDSSSSSSCKPVLDKLEGLYLWGLPRLWALVRVEGVTTPPRVFSNLKTLDVIGCSGMRKLVPLELLQALQNLEMITVHNCEQMEEIIASSDLNASSSNKFPFTFPKLRELCLWSLPQLKSICSAKGVMICDSIECISITKCPELKRIPVQLPLLDNGQPSPPRRLKSIHIFRDSKEWWESVVEWDHPNAKNILQPFVSYSW